MQASPDFLRPVVSRGRLLFICGLAASLGIWAALTAKLLLLLIEKLTEWFFQGTFEPGQAPIHHGLGWAIMLVPALGGLVIGLLARYGSEAIRGHGIPEAMESVLLGRSRVAPRILFLKPLSAALSIGSGGPFGAEGPIIQTGGALGSVLSQFQALTAVERKALLAAGAAAGMAATFQAPVAAVLMAVELLLFELRPRTLLPVALASAVAGGVRMLLFSGAGQPLFPIARPHAVPTPWQMLCFAGLGLAAGLLAVVMTRSIYWVEDRFRRLPVHWMWWPALGGIVVGLIGLVFPAALGVGYDVIDAILDNDLARLDVLPWAGPLAQDPLVLLAAVLLFKSVAWCIALGSGTSGGVLAPLLMIGGAAGGVLGLLAQRLDPSAAVPTLWAEVCMAGVFAGTTRAPLTSVVFTLELTHDLPAFLPLLLVCALSHLLSVLLLPFSIMTEKLARRGLAIAHEYEIDALSLLRVQDVMTAAVITVPAAMKVDELFERFYGETTGPRHEGYPVVDEKGHFVGLVSRDDLPRYAVLEDLRWLVVADLMVAPLEVAHADEGLRQAAQRMVLAGVARLPIVDRTEPRRLVGILTHRDLFKALSRRLDEEHRRERFFDALGWLFSSARDGPPAPNPNSEKPA